MEHRPLPKVLIEIHSIVGPIRNQLRWHFAFMHWLDWPSSLILNGLRCILGTILKANDGQFHGKGEYVYYIQGDYIYYIYTFFFFVSCSQP